MIKLENVVLARPDGVYYRRDEKSYEFLGEE